MLEGPPLPELKQVSLHSPERCRWCGQTIPARSTAYKVNACWAGWWRKFHLHLSCYEASIEDEVANLYSGFTPYIHPRP